MTRDKSALVRLGIGAAVLLVAAYILFPAFQDWIVAVAPVLLLLLCPLMMVFCMRGMHSNTSTTDDTQKVKPLKRNPNDEP
ncbi:hypothetical protein D3C78_1793420 [compost metagenome]